MSSQQQPPSPTQDRVFVTGGTGHLGRALLPALVNAGFHVRALTRHPDQHDWLAPLGVEVIAGDVNDADLMTKAAAGCRYVVHAAGLFKFWGQRERFEQTNVQGAENVMQAALRAGVEKYVHISTIVVIGSPLPGRIVDESHPTNPVEPYQISKLEGETHALTHYRDHGLPVVILRPGAFYGPHSTYAFNRLFIGDAIKGLRIQVNNGRLITFPVYTGDVAAGIIGALERGRSGEIYNICGETFTHWEANRIVSEEAGIPYFRLNFPGWMMIALAHLWTALSEYTHMEPYYPINLKSYVFNNWRVSSEKARRELGFNPIPFRDGVRRTLDWYEQAGFWRRKKPRRG